MERLKKRADFLRLAQGRRWTTPAFILQCALQSPGLTDTPRYGITVSRRVGGAVQRNRARRRLRELARLVLVKQARPRHDYVLVGRLDALTRNWTLLTQDLETALAHVHGAGRKPTPRRAGQALPSTGRGP
jgi:ribonuclease P protein component